MKKLFFVALTVCCFLSASITPSHLSWNDMKNKMDLEVDGCGMSIDKGIERCVIAFNLIGLETVQSCEGHTDWGCPYPWITIQVQDYMKNTKDLKEEYKAVLPKALNGDREAQEKRLSLQKQIRQRFYHSDEMKLVVSLLSEFYQNRQNPYEVTLYTWQLEDQIRIEPITNFVANGMSDEDIAKWLPKYQAEMDAFTQFIIDRYGLSES